MSKAALCQTEIADSSLQFKFTVKQLVALHTERQKFFNCLGWEKQGAVTVFSSKMPNLEETLVQFYSLNCRYRSIAINRQFFCLEDVCRDVWTLICPLLPICNEHNFLCETEHTELAGTPVTVFTGIFKLLCDLRSATLLGGNISLFLRPSKTGVIIELSAHAPEFIDRERLETLCDIIKGKHTAMNRDDGADIIEQLLTAQKIKCKTELSAIDKTFSEKDTQLTDERVRLSLNFLTK